MNSLLVLILRFSLNCLQKHLEEKACEQNVKV